MTDIECHCLTGCDHHRDFVAEERFVGVDTQHGRFGEVTILRCRHCGQHWLRYHYEHEAFTASGRWWRGPVAPAVAAAVTAETALATLATLAFYYVGGSYYGGHIHQSHGPIESI